MAFSSATHDIAADGFYMLGLKEYQQAAFIGVRTIFYRIAMIAAKGILVVLAGTLETARFQRPVGLVGHLLSAGGDHAGALPLPPVRPALPGGGPAGSPRPLPEPLRGILPGLRPLFPAEGYPRGPRLLPLLPFCRGATGEDGRPLSPRPAHEGGAGAYRPRRSGSFTGRSGRSRSCSGDSWAAGSSPATG